jgi:hypothetical protein
MEDVGIFYRHLVYFMVLCYIFWRFCIVRGNLVYISLFCILYQEKSGNPAPFGNFATYSSRNFGATIFVLTSFVRSMLCPKRFPRKRRHFVRSTDRSQFFDKFLKQS